MVKENNNINTKTEFASKHFGFIIFHFDEININLRTSVLPVTTCAP